MIMEKTKRKGRYKLLLLLACILVSALTVGAVSAYLTSSGKEKERHFFGRSDLLGHIVEEKYNKSVGHRAYPGVSLYKDPRIENDSEDGKEMYVGMRLDFYIYCSKDAAGDSEGKYVHVPFNVFNRFVAIEDLNPTVRSGEKAFADPDNTETVEETSTPLNSIFNTPSALWYRYTKQEVDSTAVSDYSDDDYDAYDFSDDYSASEDAVDDDDGKSLFFFYNRKLAGAYSDSWVGTRSDRTTPLFTRLHVRDGLMINAFGVGNGETTTTMEDQIYDFEQEIVRASNFTCADLKLYKKASGAETEVLDSWSDLESKTYRGFKFKIVVNGYGVSAEIEADKETDAKEAANGGAYTTASKFAYGDVLEGLKEIKPKMVLTTDD